MQWHDMRQYHKGKSLEGHDKFTVPLPTDGDGMVGRECHQADCQPRYFKITPREETSTAVSAKETRADPVAEDSLTCPYCGHERGSQDFTTHDQLEWVKSMIIRDAQKTIQDILGANFRSNTPSNGGMFSIRLTYTPGNLPSVRHYAEKGLKRTVECDQCASKYAVYGISIFCPSCGRGSLHLHLQRSIEIIKTLLEIKSEVEAKAGAETGYHLLGNCLEDCVSLFEGFLKVIYSQALRFIVADDVYQKKISELRNSFQNLSRAENIIRTDLGWELFGGIRQAEREFMELQFAKRHVITHNLGLVDERFRAQALSWQTRGQDVEIDQGDITSLLDKLGEILRTAINKIGRKRQQSLNMSSR